MSYPALVIFDCDGVLVDSEVIDARIRSECFREAGFPISAEELAEHSGISGAGLMELVQVRFGRPPPEGFMETTRAKIISAFADELQAIEGISELLRSLTIPICVASNSHPDRVRHALQVTGLWQFFHPHLFSATMVERGKPAPDLFLFAAERLNVSPAACLVIEDSVHGTIAAQAAGMAVVGFCGGSHCKAGHAERLLAAGCMRVFTRMSEFGEFLQSLDESQ
jgi:HAD superfamily hydrolase (TIGR01509 family)